MYLIWGCACERQQSRHTHKPAQHPLRPHNQASPSPTAGRDPRFQTPAGCWQAHTGQPSHLAGCSHGWRARRPDTAPRSREGAFAHSTTAPLHFYALAVATGSPPARPCPQTGQEATPRPPSPASRPGKRRRNPPSRQNRRGATPRTHTGWKQRPELPTTIPTPCTRSRTVSMKRETVPGA